MIICRSYMFKFRVSKDMEKKGYDKGSCNMEGNITFMSNTNCQKIKN